MVLVQREVVQALRKKGFSEVPSTHHQRFVYHNLKGEKTAVYTRVSNGQGARDIAGSLLQSMAKQVGLSKDEFADLVKCPLSREEYEKIVFGSAERSEG